MYFINPVITDLVQAKVNEAVNNNQPLTFTKLSIGKGKQVGDLKKITSIKTHFMNLSIAKELQGDTTILSSRLSNEGFVNEEHITELGIFARVGSTGPEFLFMYTCADQGDIIPPANRGSYVRTYKFETTLRSDGELTINVVDGAFLTPEVLEEHTNDKSNPHSVTKEQLGLVNVTTDVDGLMSKGDKFKLDTVELGAQINRAFATQAQAETGTDNSTDMTPFRTKQAITKQAMMVVNHGTNANTARPTGALSVYWIGSVEPTNATDNDLWIGG